MVSSELEESLTVYAIQWCILPKGPYTQYLGTWDFGTSHFRCCSKGFGEVFENGVLGPLRVLYAPEN